MFVRCAYFIGDVAAENRETFDSFIDTQSAPILATFPGLKAFRILRGRWYEEGAPGIYMTIELTFESLADIEAALASEQRARNLEKMKEILPLFEGQVRHVNYEVGAAG